MQTQAELLSHPLPKILFTSGTSNPNNPNPHRLHNKFLSPWEGFKNNVTTTLNNADLSDSQLTTTADPPDGELIMVGNKHSLIGRFQENVGVVLGKAFNASKDEKLKYLRFGDSQVVRGPGGEADVLIIACPPGLRPDGITCRVVSVFRMYWTQPYIKDARISEALDPVDPQSRLLLECLEGPIGQLARHMVYRQLRYGFMSTYEYTIFVKRTGHTRFEITDPIKFDSTKPSIRECFYYMGTLGAGDDYSFPDPKPAETFAILKSGNLNADNKPSTSFRNPHKPGWEAPEDDGIDDKYVESEELQETTPPSIKDTTPRSIIFGKNMMSQHLFQIQEDMFEYSGEHKRVFVGSLNGIECIAKCFPADLVESYVHERNTYRLLPPSRYFPKMLAFGDIVISREFQDGHIIIFTKEKGIRLSFPILKNMPQEEKTIIRRELIYAVKVLRSIDVKHSDPTPGNVLWNKDSGKLVMLDLECTFEEDRNRPADEWEVNMVMGTKLNQKGF
ncbi:hypothetical protein TWF506_005019 [Arthrobotrys conoides]|uniref:Protein kinase domain-containing protein n=1 Tax=Arthrobotrys conoides TaxID=74498 RepID=A0AAN8RPL8_9PEZI